MKTILFALTLSLLIPISGCKSLSWLEDESAPESKIYLNAKSPDPVELEGSKWYTVTPENAEKKFGELRRKGTDEAFICVDDTGFNNLSTDMEKLQALIKTLKDQLEAYKNFYEPAPKDSKEQ